MAAAAPPQDAAPEPPSAKQRAWLQHAATPEQLSFFAANGYLPIPEALDPDLLRRVTAVVDEVAEAVWSEKEQAAASAGDGPEPRGEFNYFPCVLEGPAMLELLDCPATFPLLWDIMGWNLQCYHSVISVKPPEEPPDEPLPPSTRGTGYHQVRPALPHPSDPQPASALLGAAHPLPDVGRVGAGQRAAEGGDGLGPQRPHPGRRRATVPHALPQGAPTFSALLLLCTTFWLLQAS